jgi:glycosyltransferase involved in cell wall biosynthesis
MLNPINYFFRKRHPHTHSIEELFYTVSEGVENSKKIEIPFYSSSFINIFSNILFASKNQSNINHITGDCHYIMLGLSSKNLNILTIHDCVILDRTSKWNPKYYIYKWLWFSWPINKADIVTVISEKTKLELIKFLGIKSEKIQVVSNFVDPSFKYLEKEFNPIKPNILQIGTNSNKNIENVILALKNIPCCFTIIGKLTKNQIELLKENKIDYQNHVGITKNALIEHYQKADIVTFVSTYEGFGMPIIEAQAIGRVVITSDLSPMKEVAGLGACFINPLEIDTLNKKILKIINDKIYREGIIKAGQINVQKYDFEVIKKQYESNYKQKI